MQRFRDLETGVRVVFRHEGNDERGHVVRHVDRLQLPEVAHDVPEVHGRSEGGGDLGGAAVRRARRRAGGIGEEGYRVAGVHEGVDRVRADVQHEVARPGHEAARDQYVDEGAEDDARDERQPEMDAKDPKHRGHENPFPIMVR